MHPCVALQEKARLSHPPPSESGPAFGGASLLRPVL
jgi:hypothetical protein